jgi:hypothetical protein
MGRYVREVDQISGKSYDRTRYANQWIKQHTFQIGSNHYTKNLQDYVDMKNKEHENRRYRIRLAGKTPDKIMFYEVHD